MDNCSRKGHFVSLYLFENGSMCEHEKLRVRTTEMDKFFTRSGKSFYYHAKTLHKPDGEVVTCFDGIENDSAFVLVPPYEKFICCDYNKALEDLMAKRKQRLEKLKSCSKSAPAIPTCGGGAAQQVVCESEEVSKLETTPGCLKRPKQPSKSDNCKRKSAAISSNCCDDSGKNERPKKLEHRHCVTKDKYPCCDHDSDAEENSPECDDRKSRKSNCEMPKKQSQKPKRCEPEPESENEEEVCERKPKATRTKKRECSDDTKAKEPECPKEPKKGFLANCCPCFVKKPIARPKSNFCSTKTTKLTQTTYDDLKCARKTLKTAIQAEKKRQMMYGKNKRVKNNLKCVDERDKPKTDEECTTEEQRKKMETEYRRAREKYRQRRKKMEEQIIKQFEKEQKASAKIRCG